MGEIIHFSNRVSSLEKVGIITRGKESLADLETKKRKLDGVIDKFLAGVGVDVDRNTDEKGVRFFTFGSASGMVFSLTSDNEVFLEVISPLFEIPADQELLLPLFRELLE